ncbi:MAG TPA: endonuclease III [Clostridiales bacterium]|nr:endonuclease III [Clostridiales bacterium]
MKKIISKKEKERINRILKALDIEYGTEYISYLNHETPWQLLIATILSAQCTDARVNIVTEKLFKKYSSIEEFANADIKDMEKAIYSTGFYRNKAHNIVECAKVLMVQYNNEVPNDIEELIKIPGVGRKTANVIRSSVFKEPSIVVDTHVKRISYRLGLTKEKDPEKIEYDLMDKLPKEHWILYNIQIIAHGRAICTARSPKCEICPLKDECKHYLSTQ